MSQYVKYSVKLEETKAFLNSNKVLIAKSSKENKAFYQKINCDSGVIFYEIEKDGKTIHQSHKLAEMIEKYNSIGV